MSVDDMIAVLQAAKAGKQIEQKHVKSGIEIGWIGKSKESAWAFDLWSYRVKPEPREWLVFPDCNGGIYSMAGWNVVSHPTIIKVREVLE